MDQNPAQISESIIPQQSSEAILAVPSSPAIPSQSPLKKFLPFIVIGVVFLVLLTGAFSLFAGKSAKRTDTPMPTVRPTATPIAVPTLPETTATPSGITVVATASATVTPVKSDKLVFIKDGHIYQSDLFSYTLLVKNATPAGDMLAWSPKGNYLSWRPKSDSAVPNKVTIYDKLASSSWTIKPNGSGIEIIDYAWSPDEKQLALVFHDNAYNISLFTTTSSSASPTNLISRQDRIKQIFWPTEKTLIFSGMDGISNLDTASQSARLLVSNKNVQSIKLSPIGNKILYSVGDQGKSDLYLVNLDGNFNQLLKADPNKIDMGTSGVDKSILENGFIPYALFFPQGDRLLVGFHYLSGLPLVGIYDLKDKSFKAIAPFLLSESDMLIHELLLVGPRVNTISGKSTWQVSIYTMENGTKLGMIRAIPEATSPSYLGNYVDSQ